MTTDPAAAIWLAKVQHDLVKRLLWAARDYQGLGRLPKPGELVATLIDEAGQPIQADALWQRLAEEAPGGFLLEEFAAALSSSVEAAERNDLEGVLALEGAFELLRSRRS